MILAVSLYLSYSSTRLLFRAIANKWLKQDYIMNDREMEGEKSGEERVKGKVRERKKRQLKGRG